MRCLASTKRHAIYSSACPAMPPIFWSYDARIICTHANVLFNVFDPALPSVPAFCQTLLSSHAALLRTCIFFVILFFSECWEAYNSAKPPKETCTQCKQPLEAVDGKFSGEFVAMDDGVKLHGASVGSSVCRPACAWEAEKAAFCAAEIHIIRSAHRRG